MKMSDKNTRMDTPMSKKREPRTPITALKTTGLRYPLRKGLKTTPIPSKATPHARNIRAKITEYVQTKERKRKHITLRDIMKMNVENMELPKDLKFKRHDDPLGLNDIFSTMCAPSNDPSPSNSLVADFDDFVKGINDTIVNYEDLIGLLWEYFVNQQKRYVEIEGIEIENNKLKVEIERTSNEIGDYIGKLNHARKLLDFEKKERRRAEQERDCLERQMVLARDLLFNDQCGRYLPEDTREKLAFLNNTNKSQRSFDYNANAGYGNHLKTINEVNSHELNTTGSLLSDLSYSRSEDDLDVSVMQKGNRKWKKFHPIAEEPEIKKHKSSSSNKVVEISASEKIVATTTLSVQRDGPIQATSVIESIPVIPAVEEKNSPNTLHTPQAIRNLLIPWSAQYDDNNCNSPNKRVHVLVSKTVIRPDTCGPCNKRIKFGSNMLKCKECRAVCHVDCKNKLPLPCVPLIFTPKQKESLGFISDYVPTFSPMIPALVIHCVNEVEARGLTEVGIYRVPGSEREVKQLKEKFMRGKGAPMLNQIDIHVICGCIKDFLRSLREPLIPLSLWKNFTNAVDNRLMKEIPPLLYNAINQLPQPNRDTLAYMILHLQRVAANKACKMPIENLATVFGPTIVGYSSNEDLNIDIFSETRLQSVVMEHLMNIPADFWSEFVFLKNYLQTPSNKKMMQTPSTDSLLQRTNQRGLFTPLGNSRLRKTKRFFGTSPTK